MTVDYSTDFSRYLQSVCATYQHWWSLYTLTDTVSQQQSEQKLPSLFDFGLMVQAVRRSQLETGEVLEETERLPVLAGLRKYAKEHVLLAGQLGSGKSAAIAQLLLEEAKASHLVLSSEREEESSAPALREADRVLPRIPVLVKLRQYKISVLDLIGRFLQRHGLQLDSAEIETLLLEGQFLLLVDGVNELPTEAAQRDLEAFRQSYIATPTIFTTRDLGVAGDLGIDNKLEMQPLTEGQIQQFVHAYLPTQGDQMLRQWSDRLWDLGQIPLLLWMLCELFRATGNLPPNLGLAFRYFTQSYDRKIKGDIPVADESYYWWPQLLQQLAAVTMQGETPTQSRVAISKQEAEAVLTAFLQGKVDYPPSRAKVWLEDLLQHHLIHVSIGDRVEFRHQLLQEYYAAEWLLQQLPYLSDDKLKREYLNYLKWTESLAIMLALVEQTQAVRVVQLALEVDLKLAVRLVREVKPEIQPQTVGLIAVESQLRDELFRVTHPNSGISTAFQVLDGVPQTLNKTDAEAEISALLQNLSDKNAFTRWRAAQALGNIRTEAAIPALLQALSDENHSVRAMSAQALGKIGAEAATPALLQALLDKHYWVRGSAAQALGRIGTEAATPALLQTWSDKDNFVRRSVAQALGKIGTEAAIPALLQASSDRDNSVRRSAAQGLGRIGTEAAIDALLQALSDEDASVRAIAAQALGKNGDPQLLPRLSQLLLTAESNQTHDVLSVILAIQRRYKYYNYALYESNPLHI